MHKNHSPLELEYFRQCARHRAVRENPNWTPEMVDILVTSITDIESLMHEAVL